LSVAAAILAAGALWAGVPSAASRVDACGQFPYRDSSAHWEAVFAHTTSVTQAILVRRALTAKGFKGIELEKDYCDDVEIELPGLDTPGQRSDFQHEADVSGVPISFEQPDNQKPNGAGEVSAVFGHRPTLARASQLQNDIAVKGWRVNDVIRNGIHDWVVLVQHVPSNVKEDFAAEARNAGYRVTFVG